MNSIQNETGDRSPQNAGDRQARQEQRNRLRLFSLAKPVRQIQDDSGEVTGFRQPEQEPRDVQL